MNAATDPAREFLADENSFRRFAKFFIGFMATIVLVLVLGILVAYPSEPNRLIGPLLVMPALALAWMDAKNNPHRAVAILSGTVWLATCTIIVMFAGIHAANVVTFPFLIALASWVLGRRWLVIITTLTVVLLGTLGFAEFYGHFQPTPRSSALIVMILACGTLILTAFFFDTVFNGFLASKTRVAEIADQLARHNTTLAIQEQKTNLIVQEVPVGIAVFGQDMTLTMVNKRYAGYFNKTADEVIGKSVLDVLSPSAAVPFKAAWREVMLGRAQSYRRSHQNMAGDEVVLDVRLVPRMEQDRVTGCLAVGTDVTEQVMTERAISALNEDLERRVSERTAQLSRTMETLRQAQDELVQSEARATISALVAGVSHELNTPLGNSVMTASTLSDQTRDFERLVASGSIKRSDLTAFCATLSHGTALLERNLNRANELLKKFKQVAADQASEQRRDFDLATTVQDVLGTLAPNLKRHAHQITVDIPAGIALDSYPGPLGQIVINLVNNAYMHAFEGREKGLLTISAKVDGDNVKLQFADNGVGMTHETLTHLFQPFFSTKIGAGGTGLGMNIVEGIVRKTLGGSLHVESEPNHGTRFDITIPLRAPAI